METEQVPVQPVPTQPIQPVTTKPTTQPKPPWLAWVAAHVGALGLLCLAIYLATANQYANAFAALGAALVGFGLIQAVPKNPFGTPTSTVLVPHTAIDSQGRTVVVPPPPPKPMSLRNKLILGSAVGIALVGSGAAGVVLNKPAAVPDAPSKAAIPSPDLVFAKKTINATIYKKLDITANIPAGVAYTWVILPQEGMEFTTSEVNGIVCSVFPEAPGTYQIGIAYGHMQSSGVTIVVAGQPASKQSNPPPTFPPLASDPVPPSIPPPTFPPMNEQPAKLTLIAVYDKIPSLPPFTDNDVLNALIADNVKSARWRFVDGKGNDSSGKPAPDLAFAVALAQQQKYLPYVVIADGQTVKAQGIMPSSGDIMASMLKAAITK